MVVGAISLGPETVVLAGDSAVLADLGLGAVSIAEDSGTVVADTRDLPFVVANLIPPIADGDFQAPAPNPLLVSSAAGLGRHPSLFCSIRKAPALALSPIPASPCPTGFSLPE